MPSLVVALTAVLMLACGSPPAVPAACPSSPAVDAPCCPEEVALERCESGQRWVCESGAPGGNEWFAVGCCPGEAGTSEICGG